MAGTQIKGIADAGAYPYTAGGIPGALVDLVHIREVSHTTVQTEWENKGDDSVIASGSDMDGLDLTIKTASFTPASVAAIAGGTVTTGGVAPAATTTYKRNKDDVLKYFKLAGQARAKDSDLGMGRVTYPKCGWRGGPDFGMAIDAFAELSFAARALPDDTDGDFYIYEIFDAYTALA